MGKYMKKGNITGEVAAMEFSTAAQSSCLGVRTRARTLAALQRLSDAAIVSPAPPPPPSTNSYLQLRSRRLEKSVPPPQSCNLFTKPSPRASPSSRIRARHSSLPPANSPELDGGGGEASSGENLLDFAASDRNSRETTPCSLIRDPSTATTPPGSIARRARLPDVAGAASAASPVIQSQHRPTAHEMDDFFAAAEQLQQRAFVEKYNFDPAADRPLPGRYEWAKLQGSY